MTTLSKQNGGKNQFFSYVNFVHAIAGGCGSAFAMTVFYPLETVRTRLQLEDDRKSKNTFEVMTDIYQQEGISGLYRGLLPVIESLYCSNFVYFYTFHALKRYTNQDKSALKDLFLGMVAGSINVLTTTPLWVVNTRMKMQGTKQLQEMNDHVSRKYRGLIDGLILIAREEGLRALWASCLPSLILVINPAIQFMTYEAIKKRLVLSSGKGEISAVAAFLTGAVAKLISTILTYPLQLVQTKQRHGHSYEGLARNANIAALIMYIIRLQGARGLYKGLEAKLIQTVLTTALMFVCYEKIVKVVFYMFMKNKR